MPTQHNPHPLPLSPRRSYRLRTPNSRAPPQPSQCRWHRLARSCSRRQRPPRSRFQISSPPSHPRRRSRGLRMNSPCLSLRRPWESRPRRISLLHRPHRCRRPWKTWPAGRRESLLDQSPRNRICSISTATMEMTRLLQVKSLPPTAGRRWPTTTRANLQRIPRPRRLRPLRLR